MSIVAPIVESAKLSAVTMVTSNESKDPRTLLMARCLTLKVSSECAKSSFQVPTMHEG